MPHQTVSVTAFKAKCLAMLEELGEHGGTITITKRGRPLATVRPAHRSRFKPLEGLFAGKIDLPPDPVDLTNLWECTNPLSGKLD